MAQELCSSSAPGYLPPARTVGACVSSLDSWVQDLGPVLWVPCLWSSLCPFLLLHLTGLPGWTLGLVHRSLCLGLSTGLIDSNHHHLGWGHTWFLAYLPLEICWYLLFPEKRAFFKWKLVGSGKRATKYNGTGGSLTTGSDLHCCFSTPAAWTSLTACWV